MILSPYQVAIDEWVLKGRGNAVVNAVAGAGKSTQIRRNVKMVSGKRLLCAFNTHIAKENATKIGDPDVASKTIHSLGMSIVRSNTRARLTVEEHKYGHIVKYEFDSVKERNTFTNLFDLMRSSLVNSGDVSGISNLIEHHSMEGVTVKMIDLLPKVARTGLEQAERGLIDFTDMIWLPGYRDMKPGDTFDWVFCDELQDLSPAQAEVVAKLLARGGRFVGVGDPRQAIMGFAGADSNSFYKLKERFDAVELPLSITYRCPLLVVKKAQQYVPHLEAREDAPEGIVGAINETELVDKVQQGDLVLCRLTAPLIKQCIKMILNKIPARVRGREIGKTLTTVVRKVAKKNFGEFTIQALDMYQMDELAKLERQDYNESAIEAFNDKINGLRAIWAAYADSPEYSADDFCADIESLFSDQIASVLLSTIHKAKGLEFARVFILKPSRLGHGFGKQNAWQMEQEENLAYVAYTRAIEALYTCTEDDED